MIEIKALSYAYRHDKKVLHEVSLNVKPGEIVNILGPNGSGKSTLLKAILGLIPIAKGHIFIDDKDMTTMSHRALSRIVSYVPQQHHGAFHYTVADIVLMSRTTRAPWLGFSKEDIAIAHSALEKVRMQAFANRSYLELSGGERQLVMIARAIAQQAQYFVMDEPVTGLDYGNQFHLLETIADLSSDAHAQAPAFILTTHHPEHAKFLGGRAVVMNQGRITADGPVKEEITLERMCALYGLQSSLLKKSLFF